MVRDKKTMTPIKKIIVFLLFIIFNIGSLYAQGNTNENQTSRIEYSSLEEIYVTIRVNKLQNDFYPMFEVDGIRYIEFNELLKFMDIYTLEVKDDNSIQGTLEGKIIDKSIDFEGNIKHNESLYMRVEDISRILPLKSWRFDDESYTLVIVPKFKLPYEAAMEALDRRRALEYSGEEPDVNKVYSNKKSLFDLGIVSAEYEKYDFGSSGDILTLGYAGQILYGDFDISGDILDETELNYVNLDYYNVKFLGDRDVKVGDFYLRTYSQVPVERSLRGISILGNETYGRKDNDSVVIDGYARGAEVVEIYQNGILVDYMDIGEDDIYKFEVETIRSDDEYIIKSYFSNGRVLEETRYVLTNTKIFPKGNWDYIVQAGKGRYHNEDQAMFNIKHGISNNMTIGAGLSRFKGNEGQKYNIVEGNLAYRTGALKYPSLVTLDYFYDTDAEDRTYLIDFIQKIGDYTFNGEYNYYGKGLGSDRSGDREASISLRKSYKSINWKAKYSWEKTDGNRYEEAEFDIYYRKNNYRLYLLNTYERYSGFDDLYTAEIGIDYTGFRHINLNLSTEIKSDGSEANNEYQVRFSRAARKGSDESYLDMAVEVEYDESDEWVASLELTYYFDKFMRMELPVTMDIHDDAPNVGLSIEKAIALEDPMRLQGIKERDTFWVDGRVFRDSNGNGRFDDDEVAIEGVGIKIGRETVFTDQYGRYLVQNIMANKDQEVILIRETLDPTLDVYEDKIYINGNIGEGMVVDIPLLPQSSVAGYLNIVNENKNNSFIYSKSIIEFLKDGKVEYSTSFEMDGFFILETILPGDYDVEITYLGNNKELIAKEPFKLSIARASDGDYYEVEYDMEVKDTQAIEEKGDTKENTLVTSVEPLKLAEKIELEEEKEELGAVEEELLVAQEESLEKGTQDVSTIEPEIEEVSTALSPSKGVQDASEALLEVTRDVGVEELGKELVVALEETTVALEMLTDKDIQDTSIVLEEIEENRQGTLLTSLEQIELEEKREELEVRQETLVVQEELDTLFKEASENLEAQESEGELIEKLDEDLRKELDDLLGEIDVDEPLIPVEDLEAKEEVIIAAPIGIVIDTLVEVSGQKDELDKWSQLMLEDSIPRPNSNKIIDTIEVSIKPRESEDSYISILNMNKVSRTRNYIIEAIEDRINELPKTSNISMRYKGANREFEVDGNTINSDLIMGRDLLRIVENKDIPKQKYPKKEKDNIELFTIGPNLNQEEGILNKKSSIKQVKRRYIKEVYFELDESLEDKLISIIKLGNKDPPLLMEVLTKLKLFERSDKNLIRHINERVLGENFLVEKRGDKSNKNKKSIVLKNFFLIKMKFLYLLIGSMIGCPPI